MNLQSALRDLAEAGIINRQVSGSRLKEAIEQEGRDWEYVIGYALYG